MTDLQKKKGQLGTVYGVVMSVIGIGILLIVGAILLGQLDTINTNNLGNNSNATLMVDNIFALLSTTQGVVVLVVVIALLAVALGFLLSSFFGGRGR